MAPRAVLLHSHSTDIENQAGVPGTTRTLVSCADALMSQEGAGADGGNTLCAKKLRPGPGPGPGASNHPFKSTRQGASPHGLELDNTTQIKARGAAGWQQETHSECPDFGAIFQDSRQEDHQPAGPMPLLSEESTG